ncbi:Clp protease N-terminal domain-containing protein [Arthrobacter sp. RCC_34]|uniref:Clp protease N-terminal domain-containing protein n=1 Tax=Arthrobacter sp. RCC_34 TaxID=3239230 RepID=UPI003523C0E1
MFERFAHEARETVTRAVAEAGLRGDRKVSTDHLLIGVVHDPGASQSLGVTADELRELADALDREALARVGIDVERFGPLAPAAGAGRASFTPGAKDVLRRALGHAADAKSRRIGAAHLLLALEECAAPEPAAILLARLRELRGPSAA